eukprot:GHVU01102894.1.p1 GENE.GHVU01102894.1~~GHVU01102894.1.p1  ORF type:complete len:311 (+),score=29.92 GHVU01102894.1:3866-4798(+)
MGADPKRFNWPVGKTWQTPMTYSAGWSLSAGGPPVFTASDDNSWRGWALPQCECGMRGRHKDWLGCVAVHPMGSLLFSGGGDAKVMMWNLKEEALKKTWTDHHQPVWSLSCQEQGNFLLSGSGDHTAKIIDIQAECVRETLRGHKDSVNSVAYQPNNGPGLLFTASADKTVSYWDPRVGRCSHTFCGHQHACNSVAASPCGMYCASADAAGSTHVWDMRTLKVCGTHKENDHHATNQVIFDRSGKHIVTASANATLSIIRVGPSKAEVVRVLRGHKDSVQAVALSSSGMRLVSGGSDGELRIWIPDTCGG